MKKLPIVMALSVGSLTMLPARGQTAPPTTDTVSRAEYEQLKKDQAELRKEIAELKRARPESTPVSTTPTPRGSPAVATAPPGGPTAATTDDLDEIDKTLRDIKGQLREYKFGTEKLLIAGDAAFGYTAQRGTKSTFSAGIAPLALWQPTDRLLIEAAADIGISNDGNGASSTSFGLTIANASFIVSDNLIVGAGLFVAPFGVYHRHFDPPWINKLPDDPLVFSNGGLAPGSVVGFYASGATPVGGGMKVLYDGYVSNGPNLETQDPGTAGLLHFDNFNDLNNNKAVGGRIAIQPITELELGYSVQYGKAGATGFKDVSALLQAVDFAYRREFQQIFGTLDVHGEWVFSNVGKATYDRTGALGFGPTRFSNSRDGGYILVAYRPTAISNKVLRNIEYVARFDMMSSSLKAPGGDHERRLTLGIDYWITPAAVFKVAYEFDNKRTGPGANAFFIQLGLGL
jgi:hypothetical protein